MAGVNKAILIGNLGRDPELKYGQQSGKAVCRFTLATSERWGGEDRTEWHNIVCFDRIAEIANEYLAKGRQVYLEGRISNRKYQGNDGQDRYISEILVSNLTLLGGGGGGVRREQGDDYAPPRREAPAPRQRAGTSKPSPTDDDPFSGDFGPDPTEDDIPF